MAHEMGPYSKKRGSGCEAPATILLLYSNQYSAGRGALGLHLQHVQRLARAHEEVVALRPAEGEVGAHLGEADAADEFSVGVVNEHPRVAERRVGAAP